MKLRSKKLLTCLSISIFTLISCQKEDNTVDQSMLDYEISEEIDSYTSDSELGKQEQGFLEQEIAAKGSNHKDSPCDHGRDVGFILKNIPKTVTVHMTYTKHTNPYKYNHVQFNLGGKSKSAKRSTTLRMKAYRVDGKKSNDTFGRMFHYGFRFSGKVDNKTFSNQLLVNHYNKWRSCTGDKFTKTFDFIKLYKAAGLNK